MTTFHLKLCNKDEIELIVESEHHRVSSILSLDGLLKELRKLGLKVDINYEFI